MFRLLIGAAIGYVLGSRAGRERYEQIKRWAARAADHPAVQGAAGFLRGKVAEVVPGNHSGSQPTITRPAAGASASPA